MDYYLLTDLAARVGYHLALSGAETFRVEETIRRIIGAYGIECEAFSIPNCVMVSLEAANGKPLMVMKRVDFHGNDLESVEKLNALSRRICAETPDPSVAAQWLDETLKGRRHYSVPVYYLGNFCAAAGFCPVFGGTLRDSLFAGLLGLIIGFVSRQMDRRETNPFFSTIVEAFAMAVPAYLAAGFHLVDYIDFVIIGTLMILVPGLLITTSMRDIIYGDTNSGINRIVQVLLSAFAIALGTAAAWRVTSGVYGMTVASGSASYPAWAQAVMIFVACTGFFILFNVHDWGSILCALGGVFTWMTYLLCRDLGMSIYSMNFFAAVVSALYSELMARSRKYPVTSYLVISLLPLVPGAGIHSVLTDDLPAAVPVETDCLVQPFADTPVDREAVAKNVYLELINQAQKRLYICTPYLILDNDLLSCLRLAAKRGVDVRIYTPGVPDKPTIYQLTRSYFPHLLRAGVKIYSYTPGFLHAKTWLVDDRIAAVGTVNLDYRSLYLHFENSVLLYGGAVLDDVRRDLAEIEKESAAVTLADCRTGFFGTLYSAVLRLVAPLC